MELNQFIPLLITFIVSLTGSYITIRVTITEIKKDLIFLKDRIEKELSSTVKNEIQAKEDMKEVKNELKLIVNSLNDVKINFAKMEARSEGKDDVINELKDAVTTILKQR